MITIANPPSAEFLAQKVAELLKAFPDAKSSLRRTPEVCVNPKSGMVSAVHFAHQQGAWCDYGWAWEPEADCPPQRNCNQPVYVPCPSGGRFSYQVSSIGD